MYQNELGIVASAADHATWDAALSNGRVTTASFENTLSTTPDGVAAVNSVYTALLDRVASGTGLAWAESVIGKGLLSTLRSFVSTSTELTSDLNAIGQQLLSRPLSTAEISSYEKGLAQSATLDQVRQTIANSPEASIHSIFLSETGGPAPAYYVNLYEAQLAAGSSLSFVRGEVVVFPAVTADLNGIVQEVSGHGASAAQISAAQTSMTAGGSLTAAEDSLFASQMASTDVTATGAAINVDYEKLTGIPVNKDQLAAAEAQITGGVTLAAFRTTLATSPAAQAAIDALYEDVLGREVDPSGLSSAENTLTTGGALYNVRSALAYSAESVGLIKGFYQTALGRAPSTDELTGMKYAIAADIPANALFGFYRSSNTGAQYPLTPASNPQLALTSAAGLLAQLPVAITLSNGGTPQLSLPYGATVQFTNATQLAAAVLGLTLRQGEATAASLSSYQATITWLVQIDQPMLQVANNLSAEAAYDTGIGKFDQASLASVAYGLALQIAALPPASRHSSNYGLEQTVTNNGHDTTVIVFNDTSMPLGNVLYEDIPNDPIGSIIEQAVTVVADVLAFVPGPDALFAPLAVVLNAAEAGKSFADGNVLGGVLNLASAAGFGLATDGLTASASDVLAVTAAVGGTSAVVQSAKTGDPLGAIAGGLTIAAAAASQGIGIDKGATVLGQSVTAALSAAATGTAVADALNRGDMASALITSLGPLLSTVAAAFQQSMLDNAAAVQQAISSDKVSATQSLYAIPIDGTAPLLVAGPPATIPIDPGILQTQSMLQQMALDSGNAYLALHPELATATPQAIGTALHLQFATDLKNNSAMANFTTEQSFDSNGIDAKYGTANTIRTDVVEYDALGQPVAVFDYKIGSTLLTYSRQQQILPQLFPDGNVNNVPVLPIYLTVVRSDGLVITPR